MGLTLPHCLVGQEFAGESKRDDGDVPLQLHLQVFHLGEPLVDQCTKCVAQLQLWNERLCKLKIPVQ